MGVLGPPVIPRPAPNVSPEESRISLPSVKSVD